MRTTVTLDSDIAARLNELASERGATFKATINATLRAGLDSEATGGHAYEEVTHELGVRAGIDLTKAMRLAAELEDEETVRKLDLRKVKILDLNLLIYAVDNESHKHPAAASWWNATLSGSETVGLAWTVLLGFVRLTTNPRIVSSPLEPESALDHVDRWLDHPVTTIVDPTNRHPSVLRDLLGASGTAGNLVADAHLAALAIEHGAELCSADRDFGRFRGLTWVNPLAA